MQYIWANAMLQLSYKFDRFIVSTDWVILLVVNKDDGNRRTYRQMQVMIKTLGPKRPRVKNDTLCRKHFWNVLYWKWIFILHFKFHFKLVPVGPIGNNSAVIQVMTWCGTSPKPLPKPLMTQCTNAYMSPRLQWVNPWGSNVLYLCVPNNGSPRQYKGPWDQTKIPILPQVFSFKNRLTVLLLI